MDSAGAKSLQWRLEQQANWRQARTVLEGRQPATDPDADELDRMEDGLRLYRSRRVHGVVVTPCKRLIDGVWMNGTVEPTQLGLAS